MAVNKQNLIFIKICLLFIALLAACTSSTTSVPQIDDSHNRALPTSTQEFNDTVNLNNQKVRQLDVDLTVLGDARDRSRIDQGVAQAKVIFSQCRIALKVNTTTLPDTVTSDITSRQRYELTRSHVDRKPAIFIVNSTVERDVAYSYLPSIQREVSGTAWLTNRVSDRCLGWIMAHEVGHILMDNSIHHSDRNNVMNAQCSVNNYSAASTLPRWTEDQCSLMVRQLSNSAAVQ